MIAAGDVGSYRCTALEAPSFIRTATAVPVGCRGQERVRVVFGAFNHTTLRNTTATNS
jgi:hypothetical protein